MDRVFNLKENNESVDVVGLMTTTEVERVIKIKSI